MKPTSEKRISELAQEGASEWKDVVTLLSDGDSAQRLTQDDIENMQARVLAPRNHLWKVTLKTWLIGALVVGATLALLLRRPTPVTPLPEKAPTPDVRVEIPPTPPAPPSLPTETEKPKPKEAPRPKRQTTVSMATSKADDDEAPSEALLLARAMRQLKQENQPKQAIETLAMYELYFPKGELLREANITHIEALAAAGEFEKALQLIEKTPLLGMPREREFRRLRIQLEVHIGRCQDARLHFMEETQLMGSEWQEIRNLGSAVELCR